METRHQRPAEGSSLPLVSLLVLVVVVLGLLYIGYSYFAEDDALSMTPQRSRQEQAVATPAPAEPAVATPTPVTPEPIAGDDEPGPAIDPADANTPTYTRSTPEGTLAAAAAKAEAARKDAAAKNTSASVARVSTPAGGTTASHTIGKGQTIYSVSTRYGIPVKKLETANPGLNEKNFNSGKTIRVPVRAVHTVGKGDILRVVAQKYGTTVEALMKANGKTKNFTQRGEKLVIPY